MTTVIKSQTCTKSVTNSKKAGNWLFKLYLTTQAGRNITILNDYKPLKPCYKHKPQSQQKLSWKVKSED